MRELALPSQVFGPLQGRAAHVTCVKVSSSGSKFGGSPQVEVQTEARILGLPCGHARYLGERPPQSCKPNRSEPRLALGWGREGQACQIGALAGFHLQIADAQKNLRLEKSLD